MSLRSTLKSVLPRQAWHGLRRLYYAPQDVAARVRQGSSALIPPRHMVNTIGGGDAQVVGREFFRHFVDVGGLRANDSVLDVGCGVGRMALPLTEFLTPKARYEGFDIAADEIRWCARHITRKYPNFRFQVSDVYNAVYNARGTLPAAHYRFPFEDGEFSFVFLTSVFTHLRPDDQRNYLFEAARVLRPGGRLFATFFLLNAESVALITAGNSSLNFAHALDGCRTTDRNTPELAIAFQEEMIVGLHREAGLEAYGPIHHGSWCGRTRFLSYQDIVVCIKR